MATYSRRTLDFLLFEVFQADRLTAIEYFANHNRDNFNLVLDTAESIAAKYMRPAFRESDKIPPLLENGKVNVHPALPIYFREHAKAGLIASTFSEANGGQQLPTLIYAAADFIEANANNGFEIFANLARAAASVIETFASDEVKAQYLPKILSGEYTATMAMTEPQAGSSLGDLMTSALHLKNNSYRVKGQKVFISTGDHNATDNIVHLVLGRVHGSPRGVKGLSLFLVPKLRPKEKGLEPNDVTTIGIAHKMGQRCTPAVQLEFGEHDDCIGFLIGEVDKGLSYMFQMMNMSRLNIGLVSTSIASHAYYVSLQYAKERKQGRHLTERDPTADPVPIISHSDVRRMLLMQKALTEGTLGLVFQCYLYTDQLRKTSSDNQELIELLTTVAKAVGSDNALISVNNAMQVLGGYGYTEDFVIEQLVRDVRIMSLYEGTNGIQSLTLLGRYIKANNGAALTKLVKEIKNSTAAASRHLATEPYASLLNEELDRTLKTTSHLLNLSANGDQQGFLCDASLYMDLIGRVCISWQWLLQATVAAAQIETGALADSEIIFYRSRIDGMKFYFHYELVKTSMLHARLTDDTKLTVLKKEETLI